MTIATATHTTWAISPADFRRGSESDAHDESRRSQSGATVVALHALGGAPAVSTVADISAEVISVEVAAQLCNCQPQRILERLRVGDLPGVKFGHGWTVPRLAFIQRLNELALEESAARRLEACTVAANDPVAPPPVRRGPGRPPGSGKKHLTRPA